MCCLPFAASLVLVFLFLRHATFFQVCVWRVSCIFVSSETGTPALLKHHVYASDIAITSNNLVSKYDIKMGPKCSSIMNPPPRKTPSPKTPTPERFGNVPRYFHIYSIRVFHAYAYKKKPMAYPDPQPDPCKDFLVVYHTQIFSICDVFVKRYDFRWFMTFVGVRIRMCLFLRSGFKVLVYLQETTNRTLPYIYIRHRASKAHRACLIQCQILQAF